MCVVHIPNKNWSIFLGQNAIRGATEGLGNRCKKYSVTWQRIAPFLHTKCQNGRVARLWLINWKMLNPLGK